MRRFPPGHRPVRSVTDNRRRRLAAKAGARWVVFLPRSRFGSSGCSPGSSSGRWRRRELPRSRVPPPTPAAMPTLADVVSVEDTAEPPVPAIDLSTWSGRTDVYPFGEVILESLFGKPDPDTWRPLPLSTFFSEGWNEAWVPSPNGSGGSARQGWINAADGNMYRLWFFTFAQAFNQVPKGNAYLGSYTLFTPLSRRLDLIINIPFVLRNNAVSGLPIIDPNNPQATVDVQEPHGIRRYLVHAPLLAARDEGLLAHEPNSRC